MRLHRLIAAAAVMGVAALPLASYPQTYPSRPIRVITTFAPTGETDVVVRTLTEAVATRSGATVVIEARPGGLGAVGLQALKGAEPDGHTIGFTATGHLLVNPHVNPDLGYDPIASFAPIGKLLSSPVVFLAHPSLGVSSMAELISLAKAKPATVRMGIGGAGNKIGLAQLEAATGAKFLQVPYTQGAQLISDQLGGHIDASIQTVGQAMGMAKDGRVRAIGIGSLKSFPQAPGVPAVADVVPNFEMGFWWGLLAPAGTPKDRIEWVNREFVAALNTPAVRDRMIGLAYEIIGDRPEQFAAYIRKSSPEFAEIIRKNKITN
jgi:tripartite-type tricarboxylate transporter receptor subunit TctC